MQAQSYINYLFLCNKLSQNLELKTTNINYLYFFVSRIWGWLSWMPLAQGLSWGYYQGFGQAAMISRLNRGRIYSQVHLCGSWQVSVTHWLLAGDFRSCLIGMDLLTSRKVIFSRTRVGVRDGDTIFL